MPSRILPGCSTPRCPRRSTPQGKGKCEQHIAAVYQEQDERRGTSAERGYGHAWRKLRAHILSIEPLCRSCAARGRVAAGSEVDHVTPKSKGGTDDVSNLQSLCKSCHSDKTMRESVRGTTGAIDRTYPRVRNYAIRVGFGA